MTGEDDAIFIKYKDDSNYLFVWNKIDKSSRAVPAGIIPVSAVTSEGFSELENSINSRLTGMEISGSELMIDSLRQKELLDRAAEALAAVKLSLENNISLDAVALDLKEALDALGEITGEVTSEDILNNIFAGFCVGK